jgi:ribosome-associated protein
MEQKLKLDQFLKIKGVVRSGGEAKHIIQSGMVKVNGQIETRRGRKLVPGDVVAIDDLLLTVDEWLG